MKLKRHEDFLRLNENHHSDVSKEIEIREPSAEEHVMFCKDTYASTKPGQNILDMICDYTDTCIGAFEDNVMIGALVYSKSKIKKFTSIDAIFVHPDHRYKEIGKLLITYVEDNVKTNLITNPYTYEAEEFFTKVGFVIDEEIDPEDTNSMVKYK